MTRAACYVLALGSLCPSVEAATLGRLFFTPAERRAIEQTSAMAAPSVQKYQGRIRYPDGRIEYWLDGKRSSTPPPATLKIGEPLDNGRAPAPPLDGDHRTERLWHAER